MEILESLRGVVRGLGNRDDQVLAVVEITRMHVASEVHQRMMIAEEYVDYKNNDDDEDEGNEEAADDDDFKNGNDDNHI